MRTLLVGLDAACRGVLDPLFEAEAVPALRRLFEAGASGTLESQVPPWTASAWPSLYTGTNPGKHGVFGFLHFDGYDHEVVDATRVREPPLWELLDRHGHSSVVVNVPVTHPPGAFDGALIPGYTAPDPPTCHPEGLLADVEDAVGEYRVYAGEEGTAVDDREEQLSELCDLAGTRGAAFEYLADRFDPAFGFLQFQVTDTVCHQFPGDLDAVGDVYRAVDGALAGVLDACDPDAVVVASDHGVGPCERRVAVNEVLREAGLVSPERGGEGMPTWATLRDRELRDAGSSPGPVAGAAALAGRLGVTTQRVGRVLRRFGVADLARRVAPDAVIRAGSERVDFAASAAYVRSRVECGVRLNVRGREPDGVVPPAEYDAVRDEVIALLAALRTPDDHPVFEAVRPREHFFDGPALEDAVDVVAVPEEFDSAVTSWLTGEVFPPTDGPTWDHKRHGAVAVWGDGVDATAPTGGAHLFDVAPTVLATLGVPAAERMDGEALAPVEPAGRLAYDEYDAPDEDTGTDPEVEERLADLGYLE